MNSGFNNVKTTILEGYQKIYDKVSTYDVALVTIKKDLEAHDSKINKLFAKTDRFDDRLATLHDISTKNAESISKLEKTTEELLKRDLEQEKTLAENRGGAKKAIQLKTLLWAGLSALAAVGTYIAGLFSQGGGE